MKANIVDYRKFRLNKLNSDEFKHLKYLIFWPIFGLLFLFVEKDVIPRNYHVVECAIDYLIPFCEYFLIPYMFWFIYLVGAHVYTLLFDVKSFEKMMRYFIITYAITILIYFIYPTAQELRPTEFARDNAFIWFIKRFYAFDTNTNVCPSLHVVGSFAAMFGFWHSDRFNKVGWKIALSVITASICISTMFMKQHSLLDIIPALAICGICYPIVYGAVKFNGKKPKIMGKKFSIQHR